MKNYESLIANRNKENTLYDEGIYKNIINNTHTLIPASLYGERADAKSDFEKYILNQIIEEDNKIQQ